jgi:hypothetical protein
MMRERRKMKKLQMIKVAASQSKSNLRVFCTWYFFVAKRRSFEHKRKSHYNEFMAVKLARQLMQKDEEEVENNEEDRLPEKDSCVEVEETEVDDVEGF